MDPTTWLDTVSDWAPYVLGALAITTTLVHGLRPIARAVQRWTITTAATWDDGPARWCADRLDWLAGALDAVLGALPHVTVAPGSASKSAGKGGSAALVMLLAVTVSGSLASGCGASTYQVQARAAHLTALATDATGQVIDAARDHALDEVEAAHPEHGAERTAALEAEAARWRPAGQALDAIRSALLTWVTSLEAARVLGEDGAAVLWPRALAIAAQVADLYGRVAALARELGATGVPELPAALSALLAGAGGAQ